MRGLELISLEKCKEIELDMFRQIIKVCEKYKLRYILDYGTLIGAVRHGGFIPWDDDIDISMPRPDYNVFKQVFDKETEDSRYELRTGMKGNIAIPYIQVVHQDTITQKKGRRETYAQALWVDVFPVDGAGDSAEQQREIYDKYWDKIHKSRRIFGRYKPYLNPWKQLRQCYWHHLKKFQLGKIIGEAEALMQTYDYDSSRNVFCYPTVYGTKEKNSKSYYEDRIIMDFEGISCRIPREHDKKLRGIYGDYTKLPPEDQRKGHEYLAFWR